MSVRRMLAGGAVAAALMAGVVALSWVPWVASAGDDGELRLAWRWRSSLVERCRPLSAEEQRNRPVHMRASVSCERALRPYLLDVRVDGRRIILDSVRARGAESDRPLSVFRRIPLPPGRHTIEVTFRPLVFPGDSSQPREEEEEDEADDEHGEPAPLELSSSFVVEPRQVVLVTLDDGRGVLVLKTGSTGAAGRAAPPGRRSGMLAG